MSDVTRGRTVEGVGIDSDRFRNRFGVFGGSSRRGTDIVTRMRMFCHDTLWVAE